MSDGVELPQATGLASRRHRYPALLLSDKRRDDATLALIVHPSTGRRARRRQRYFIIQTPMQSQIV